MHKKHTHGSNSNDSFEKRFPFDRKNPLGFTVAIALESFALWLGFCFSASMATFGIGIYLFVMTFTKLIKESLYEINRSATKKNGQALAREQFLDFIQFQSEEKQLSEHEIAFD